MAEIKIEKKKPIWPWIILVLVILALLYFFVFADDDSDNQDENNTEQVEERNAWEEDNDTTNWETETDTTGFNNQGTSSTGQGVEGYLAHISDENRMGVDHQYTNNAIIHLMNAVEAKANEVNYDISADMESIREDAREIQQDPTSTSHANKIKDAGTKLADVIKELQEENYPNLSNDAEEVRTAAQNIEESTQTLQQKDQIKKFFDEAGDVLRKMS